MIFNDSQVRYDDTDLLEFLGQQESQNVHWGDAFEEELVASFRPDQMVSGATLPWGDTHDKIRFRSGEITIHAGDNGHFKSAVTGQMAVWFAMQGEPTGIMSFEMPVRKTLNRMCRQIAGGNNPSESFIRRWSRWNHGNLAFYDKLETTPSQRVLGALLHMVKLGCKHVMIDSLTKCGLPYGERGPEKTFIDALCATAKVAQIHIHLICHVRKPDGARLDRIPGKHDVRGAGELTDLVDNVVIHWRDKKKHDLKRRAEAGITLTSSEQDYVDSRPDQRFIVEKQRHDEFQGTIGLTMDPSMQFHRGKKLSPEIPEAKQLEIVQ